MYSLLLPSLYAEKALISMPYRMLRTFPQHSVWHLNHRGTRLCLRTQVKEDFFPITRSILYFCLQFYEAAHNPVKIPLHFLRGFFTPGSPEVGCSCLRENPKSTN